MLWTSKEVFVDVFNVYKKSFFVCQNTSLKKVEIQVLENSDTHHSTLSRGGPPKTFNKIIQDSCHSLM